MSKSKCIALFIAILVAIYNFRSSSVSLSEAVEILNEKGLMVTYIELLIIGLAIGSFAYLVGLPVILEFFYKRCAWFKAFIDDLVRDKDMKG